MKQSETLAGSGRVDRMAQAPLRKQVGDVIAQQIAEGQLTPGARLASVRDLAEELGVSTLTVSHAYQDLARMGLVTTEVGRGTFVGAAAHSKQDRIPDAPEWRANWLENHFHAPRTMMVKQILKIGATRGLTMLTNGYPSPSFPPAHGYAKALRAVTREPLEDLVRAESALGLSELRRILAAWLLSEQSRLGGTTLSESQILVTHGAQAAIELIARTLVGQGDFVVVEHPTYYGALDALENRGARLLQAPVDEKGIRPDAVSGLLRAYHPKLIYVTSRPHNPSGVALVPERQHELLSLAAAHNVPIVEDDAGGGYWLEEHPRSSLLGLDTYGGVIHIGSLAKLITLGVRLGYVATSGALLTRLTETKELSDRLMSYLPQRAASWYLASSSFERDIRQATRSVRNQRDALFAALDEFTADGVTWTLPEAGFNLLVTFPVRLSPLALPELFGRAGAAGLPETIFSIETSDVGALRLSYGSHDPSTLVEACRNICRTWLDMADEAERGDSALTSQSLHA